MSFLNGLGNIFDLSTIFGPKKAEGKQGGSKPNSSQHAKSSASSKPSSSASSGPTSPVSSSGHRPSLSSPTQDQTWYSVNSVGIKPPKTLEQEEFESFMKKLKDADDIKDFKKIFNEHKNKLTPSQMKTLKDSLIKKLKSRNDRLSANMSQLKKQQETLSKNMAKLGLSFEGNSRELRILRQSLSNALTGNSGANSGAREKLNLQAGVDSYGKVDGIMGQILVDQKEQLTSIKDKISSACANIEVNKEKIKLLYKFTNSSRISGG